MMGHNVRFKRVICRIIPKLSLLPLLFWSTDIVQTDMMYNDLSIYSACIAYVPFPHEVNHLNKVSLVV